MRSGTCVKCGEEQVYGVGAYSGPYLGITRAQTGYFLVCAACGYSEHYANERYRPKVERLGTYIPPESERDAI